MAEKERELLWSVRRKDLRIDTFTCGGKGGQHQNKTASGVRITHIESGLVAVSRSFKSQLMNKKAAFRRLAELLKDWHGMKEAKERYGAGFEVVRTYHEPDDRVTDHQTGKRYSFRHTVGKGRMDVLIEERARELGMRALGATDDYTS